MTPDVQIILSGALTFGVPLLVAGHELMALRRTSGGRSRDKLPALPEPIPPQPGLAPKPLPACLVPNLSARPRVLEPT